MNSAPQAVFLSYASQDKDAARALVAALRAAGVEVWFDQAELAGGDAWDQKIRGQIKGCALFVPVISAATQARLEGYFRIEWKLAARRTHAMATAKAFLLPVVIDDTRDAEAHVPEEFRDVQWTRLPGGAGAEKFCERVRRLLGGVDTGPGGASEPVNGSGAPSTRRRGGLAWRWWMLAPLLGALGGLVLALRFATAGVERGTGEVGARAAPAAAAQAMESESMKWVRQAKALIDDDPLLVRENYRAASELCRRALALSPDNAEAWATLSRANLILFSSYHEGGEELREEARRQAERAMRLAPASADAELAMERYEYQQPGGAAKSPARLEALWTRFPRDQRIARRLAQVFYLRRDHDATRLWAERADALPGGDPTALAQIAWEAWLSGRLEEVEPALERALARGPSSSALHLEFIYRNSMGDLEGVRSAFGRMPAAVQREDRIVALVVQHHLNAGAPGNALEALRLSQREFFEEGRQFIPRGFLAGEALSMLGKTRAAEVEFRAALKAVEARLTEAPRDSRLVLWRARLLLLLGQKEEAAGQYETAVELGQRPDPALLVLLGRHEDAVAELDLRVNRANLGWAEFLQSLRNPQFDPLRANSRFKEIVHRGEGWLADIRRAGAARNAPAAGANTDPSIAVLAFANLSDEKANEYFSDGISEELLNVLAKIPRLKVAARTSAFYFKGQNVPIPEIAQKLGVAYVVEGSVRKAGDKVRITAQLIKAADGFHVWSETFTRDMKDIFAVQDEIAGLVVQQLRTALLGEPGATTASAPVIAPGAPVAGGKGRTVDVEAYQLFLEAKFLLNLKTTESVPRGSSLFRRAAAKDPGFALAWAHLAFALNWEMSLGTASFSQVGAESQAAAREAVRLAPDLPEAQAALGDSALMAWDWRTAIRASEEALRLAPGSSDVLQSASWRTLVLGDAPGAAALASEAIKIDPYNLGAHTTLGMALLFSGRLAEVEPVVRRMEAISPGGYLPGVMRWNLQVHQGRWDDALAGSSAAGPESAMFGRIISLHGMGRRAESDAELARAQSGEGQLSAYDFAMLHAFRGEVDAAFARLEKARSEHVSSLLVIKGDPLLNNLRGDPRWPQFLRGMGLADDQLK